MKKRSAAQIEEEILKKYRTIAVVGASPDPERHSNAVMRHLRDNGYRVIPVNPTVKKVLGFKSYPAPDIGAGEGGNRRCLPGADKVMPTMDEAIATGARVLWLQEGVINEAAAEKARQAGFVVVIDRCIAKAG